MPHPLPISTEPEPVDTETRLARIERLLVVLAGRVELSDGEALETKEAMKLFAYTDAESFIAAAKRDGIPYVRQRAGKRGRIIWNRTDLLRWKEARTVWPVTGKARRAA